MTQDKHKLRSERLMCVLIIVAVLVVDQIIKVLVKTNMELGSSVKITNWFFISFVENNGMAYGMTFINKLFLSILRLIAIGALCWYVNKVITHPHRRLYVVLLSLITAGAAGNMLDSMFYGLIFSASSPYYVSYLVPFGHGYAGFLMGKVVDMFYFPLIVSHYPQWVPFVGGHPFVFFSPVFNFADACITVGVIAMLLFARRDLEKNYIK